MGDWVLVCTTDKLLLGEMTTTWDGDTAIVVFNHDGTVFALEDRCSHEDFELSAGAFNPADASIECVLHGARFDVRDGRPLCPPAYEPVAKFPVRVDDAGIWTRDDRS